MSLKNKIVSLMAGLALTSCLAGSPLKKPEELKCNTTYCTYNVSQEQSIVRFMTYNIAHGRRLKKSNYEIKSKAEVKRNLDDIASLIKEENADVVCLQEVDIESTWSFDINQTQYLAEKAGFPYYAIGVKYDIDLGFFRFYTANSILSKYPIKGKNVFFENDFARKVIGGDNYVDATIDVGTKKFAVLCTHLNSNSYLPLRDPDDVQKLRNKEMAMLIKAAKKKKIPVVLAGDLNSEIPWFIQSNGKPPKDTALKVLFKDKFFDWQQTVSFLKVNTPEQKEFFTGNVKYPYQVFDYVFVTHGVQLKNYHVPKKKFSDHFPVVVDIVLP
ncbi:hypothetical protein DRO91_06585 [Candidatus Heimdallarchaeota archaeon]|nr:MAG: hypothetical protein DRO91_06585 [Candidatus Heimdallarchaeota archaeon]